MADELLEKLAELEHEQWEFWSKDINKKEDLSEDRIKRWEKCWVPYKDLSEDMQEEDRKWARKVLKIVNENKDMEKEAIKKTAIEPLDATGTAEDKPEEDLGGLGDEGGDLGGMGGGDLGGGLGGGGLGEGLDQVAEGMDNEYYDSLKVTKTPDLERQIQHDDDDLDFSEMT